MKAHLDVKYRAHRGYSLTLTIATDGNETTREIATGLKPGEHSIVARAVSAALLLAGYAVSGA